MKKCSGSLSRGKISRRSMERRKHEFEQEDWEGRRRDRKEKNFFPYFPTFRLKHDSSPHHLSFAATARALDDHHDCRDRAGARGSKLQLVLNAIFHLEASPGNLAYADYEMIKRHPAVKTAMPIAVGDNLRGYRLVGTLPE